MLNQPIFQYISIIACFGDSFTFGERADDDATLPQAFADLTDHAFKVLNLGSKFSLFPWAAGRIRPLSDMKAMGHPTPLAHKIRAALVQDLPYSKYAAVLAPKGACGSL
jgi:hypothetical protein